MKRKILVLAAVLISAIALTAVAGLIAARFLDPESCGTELLRAVRTEMNRDVRYGRGEFSLRLRPAFAFTDVVILEKDSRAVFIRADRLSFRLSLLPLLSKRIVLREVELENARMSLIRKADGSFNVSDLLEPKKPGFSFGIRHLQIHNGVLHFTDHAAAPQALETSLEKLNLRLSRLERGKTAEFSLHAALAGAGHGGSIMLDGSMQVASAPASLLESRIDAAVKAGGLSIDRFWPYYSRHVPFKKPAGRLDIDTSLRGTVADFHVRGALTMHDLHFDYPPVFLAPLKPKTVRAVYEMKRTPHDIVLDRLDLTVDGVSIRGSCLLKDIHTDDPLIDAKAVSTDIRLESFRHFIPYGIIPKGVADFVAQKIKAGIFRLEEGRLSGRISRIAHMEKNDNSSVLYIRGHAQKGSLEYAPDMPPFTDLSGTLELKGRDFILHGMTGRFGDAPFSLDGRLADYCLKTPTRYPFSLKMAPTAKEVAWLLGDERAKKLHYAGTSVLLLSGEGTTADYRLSGSWDLSGAEYRYADWLAKPAGKANHLNFKINPMPQETHFPSIGYSLPPLVLTASAKYRHAGKRALSLVIDSNTVPLGDLAPLIPKIERSAPGGYLKLAVRARSAPEEPSALRWRGEIALTDVSFKGADPIGPVSRINGKIRLRGNTIETTRMSVQLGGSAISAQGRIADIRNPIYSVSFSCERLDTADLGLRHPQQPVRLENVGGSLDFKNGDVQINALNFQLNDSILNIGGVVRNPTDQPTADIRVDSPYLDGRDIMILNSLQHADRTGKSQAGRTGPVLKADIRAASGRMDRLAFEKLQTNVMFEHNTLTLNGIGLDALGGKLTGNGRINLPTGGSPRYEMHFDLDKLSADQCLQFLDVKDRLITGAFSARGDLTAEGNDLDGLKKTALGRVQVKIDEGMLARFAVLSKIFSILNISQLLKFQLPDMVRGGMPYRRIAATLSFENGTVSTQDLFLQSDAMNLSAVGAIDMARGEFVDTVVGVQPLQTVDKVVSLIPVVGWILTDENRRVISVYFEVRGGLDDPSVTAIPVKSIARGVFDIFRNVFQLPVKLFTDTGEVILGR